MNQSPRFTLNAQDKATIKTILIHGLIGTALTLLTGVFMKLNYGVETPIITLALSMLSLFLTQYLNGPSASNIKIQELQQQVQDLLQQTSNNTP